MLSVVFMGEVYESAFENPCNEGWLLSRKLAEAGLRSSPTSAMANETPAHWHS